ncbi:MAG: hypothetical protein L3J67_08680 [Hyphomicrobiaceae bacterium]|nr:hypothetical protein [Hyphomicrobiaceae bacterium]
MGFLALIPLDSPDCMQGVGRTKTMIYPQAAELYTAFAALTIPPFLRAKNQVLKNLFCRFGVLPLENMT